MWIVNTDAQALAKSPIRNKLNIGAVLSRGKYLSLKKNALKNCFEVDPYCHNVNPISYLLKVLALEEILW